MTTNPSGQKRKKPGIEESPDKSYYILSKSLDTCGKCNKKCTSRGDAIQCDLCGMWVHAVCEGISHEKYKAIKSLALENVVYYCQINSCLSRFKNITNDYIKHQEQINTDLETMVSNISQQSLTTEYDNLQKAVANLSTRIDNLTAHESELSNQIKDTSKVLEQRPTAPNIQPLINRKSNVVVFGIEESPPKTFRSVRLQKDMESVSEIFSRIKVQVNPSQILDCYRLGKFKFQQTRPRPILVKLQRTIDVSAILANRWSLSSPFFIKPDMSPNERTTESTLLKERWSLIQAGYDRKRIKISNNRIYLDSQLFGEVIDNHFKCSNNQEPRPATNDNNTSTNVQPMDQQALSSVGTQQSS